MSKNVKKLSRKILCMAISTIMVFGTMLSTVYGVGADIDPMQEFILEAIDLDDGSRADFVEILDEVNSSNYKDYVDEVSDIIPLSDEDITLALKTYAGYSSTYKTNFLAMLESFELSEVGVSDYTSFGFRRIQKAINFEVTGDYYDDRGIRLFVSIFRELKAVTGKDAFSDKDVYKLDINVGSTTLKKQLDKFVTTIKSLEDRNITTFNDFLAYAENVINAHDNIEIYNFKKFLMAENLGYTGTLTKPTGTATGPSVSPIQQLYLKIISLSKAQKAKFALDVLDAVNTGNISEIKVKAQKYLGSMPAKDIEEALKAFAAYSDDNKELIKSFLSMIDIDDGDYTKVTGDFKDIYERINFALTGDYEDYRGFAIFVRILGTIKTISRENFVFDGSTDQYKLRVDMSNLKLYSLAEPKLNVIIGNMDSLNDRGINTFEDFIDEVEAIVNAHPNDQIYSFKKYLKTEALGYEGNLPDPTKPVVTPTPEVTGTATPEITVTPTPAVTSTATAITTPTPKPGNGGGNNGGGNSGGGNSGNSGNSGNKNTPKPTATTAVEPTSVVPGANQFTDLPDKHWAKLNMLDLVAKKILAGYTDGTIKPDAQITRAEMSVIIVKAVGLSPAATPNLKFKDNKDIGSWAAGYIQTAVDKGIIVGYEDNTFKPSNKLTREEMVVMIMKAYAYQESKKTDIGFKDKKDVGSWSMGYVAISVELGFVKGYPDNSFKPKKNVTRAEASAVIANCMKEAEKDKK